MKKAARALAVWRVVREAQRPGTPGVLTRMRAIPRMLRGALRGDYPHLSKSKIGMVGLGLAYILSPIDVVPEFLAVIGAVDDFGVLLWLLTALLGESGRYLEWERGRPAGSAGYGPIPGSVTGSGPGLGTRRARVVP
ncbi:hypothetical protein GCM10010106_13970 [Thermopolyspora flexuosa]|jgi:uncharacterized membrane protein YkvA (DUF1232 family)|uniref:Uncharacterized membrane protein YkvA (DUF1232 family) n=1 Tax=Thermopolyspora flexuosa TaxID=103836 RepID=A0A543IPX7_9ACTN|nr:DUF1232 domain-containing protein [Thermopolyspora flexuosa]TQM72633.1 uncharacterized membrane protein YkvA (DUF1232 family) [Thermopolyspora flexuosa]GGM69026.1 hypothetical protein GCM10010106_13970 [Thermopolyspora flexuosa]